MSSRILLCRWVARERGCEIFISFGSLLFTLDFPNLTRPPRVYRIVLGMLRDPAAAAPDSPEATRSLSLHSEEGGTGWPKASWKRPLIIPNEGSTGTLRLIRTAQAPELISVVLESLISLSPRFPRYAFPCFTVLSLSELIHCHSVQLASGTS